MIMTDKDIQNLEHEELEKSIAKTISTKKSNEEHTRELRERSGHVVINSYLVGFLYTLMRDHLTISDVEMLVRDSEEESTCTYTNGWLAKYAEDLANRLTKELKND